MAPQRAIKINGQTLPVREYQGQRVVTIQDVAVVHKTSNYTIKRNFERNKKHFVQGIDYFYLKGKSSTTKCGLPSQTTQINVFTESGYLMLAKSLTDDLSWQVQRELVNSYFKLRVIGDELRGKEIATSPALPDPRNDDIAISTSGKIAVNVSRYIELLEMENTFYKSQVRGYTGDKESELQDGDLLSVKETAVLLDLYPSSVYRLVQQGKLRFARKFGKLMVSKTSAEKYRPYIKRKNSHKRGV